MLIMKKITFIIPLFCTLFSFSQQHTLSNLTIIDEQFDSNGCTTSVNLEFTIDTRNNGYTDLFDYRLRLASNSTLPRYIDLNHVTSTGKYTTGNISITETIEIRLYGLEESIEEFRDRRSGGYYKKKRYALIGSANIINCPSDDIDEDGILNTEDYCPEVFGNQSNFGCPGNPDLMIDTQLSKQYSDCYTCNSTLSNSTNPNYTPVIFRYGGSIILQLVIKNIGDGDQYVGSIKLRFYLSKDKKISSDDIGFGNRTILFTPPKSGESTPVDGPYRLEVNILGATDIGNKVAYGNYYLIIIIDEPNDFKGSELNRDNNEFTIPVKYSNKLPSNKPLNIKLLSFYGQTITEFEAKSEEEARKVIHEMNLVRNIYILQIEGENFSKSTKIIPSIQK